MRQITPPSTPHRGLNDMDVSLGAPEGAAGTTYRPLLFTNTSRHTRTIRGFPRVMFVAEDGHQVGTAAVPVGEVGQAVTLRPGESAAASVGFVNVGVFDPQDCRPAEVRGLRVRLPDGREDVFVPFETTACRAAGFGTMTVRAVRASTGPV